jgi:hypothetical protein
MKTEVYFAAFKVFVIVMKIYSLSDLNTKFSLLRSSCSLFEIHFRIRLCVICTNTMNIEI